MSKNKQSKQDIYTIGKSAVSPNYKIYLSEENIILWNQLLKINKAQNESKRSSKSTQRN